MNKQDEYRQEAALSLKLAEAASNPSDRMRMLLMAEAWFKLAERRARSPQSQMSEHPFVRVVLGS